MSGFAKKVKVKRKTKQRESPASFVADKKRRKTPSALDGVAEKRESLATARGRLADCFKGESAKYRAIPAVKNRIKKKADVKSGEARLLLGQYPVRTSSACGKVTSFILSPPFYYILRGKQKKYDTLLTILPYYGRNFNNNL